MANITIIFDFHHFETLARYEQASCTRKVRYGHKETAEKAKNVMQSKTGDKFTAYECQFCMGWHIGHSIA